MYMSMYVLHLCVCVHCVYMQRVRSSYQVFCYMCWHLVEAVKALRGER